MDNEHIDYEPITFNDVSAYIGTFKERTGYVLLWVKDGIEHIVYFEGSEASLSEVYR